MSQMPLQHGERITCVAHGKQLLTSSLDGTIHFWNQNLMSEVILTEKKGRPVQYIVPHRESIFILSLDGEITEYDTISTKYTDLTLTSVFGKCFACFGNILVFQDDKMSLNVYDLDKNCIIQSHSLIFECTNIKILNNDIIMVSSTNSLFLLSKSILSLLEECIIWSKFESNIVTFDGSTLKFFRNLQLEKKLFFSEPIKQIVYEKDRVVLLLHTGQLKSMDLVDFEISNFGVTISCDFVYIYNQSIHIITNNHIRRLEDPFDGYSFYPIHHHFILEDFWMIHHSRNISWKIGAQHVDYFVNSKDEIFELKRGTKTSFEKIEKMEESHPSMVSTDLTVFWIDRFEMIVFSSKFHFSKWISFASLEMFDIPFEVRSISVYDGKIYLVTAQREQIVYSIGRKEVLEKILLSGPIERVLWNQDGSFHLFDNYFVSLDVKYTYGLADRWKITKIQLVGDNAIIETLDGFYVQDRFYPDVVLKIPSKSLDFRNYNFFDFEPKPWRCVGKTLMTRDWSNPLIVTKQGPKKKKFQK
jgi:WD40 repeat protein